MTTRETYESDTNSWPLFFGELVRRTRSPARHVSFVLYFFLGVIVLGGLGIWVELIEYIHHPESLAALRTALVVFFPALIGTSCMDLLWSDNEKKYMRAFSVIIVAIFVATIFVERATTSSGIALCISTIASLAALWVWWVANADQPHLRDVNLDAPVGGEASPAKTRLPGDETGFTT